MANVNIDGTDYDVDSLSDKAKTNIASLQFVKQQIARLSNEIAVYKTSELAYSTALKSEIESIES